jgi:hypothetical protein
MFLARFENVGRQKLTWIQEYMHRPRAGELEMAVRKKGVLMSNNVEVWINEDTATIVAGFHEVGRVKIVEVP